MTHMNGNGKGSVDTRVAELSPFAEAVLKGMKESGRNGYTVLDMTGFAGGPYRRQTGLQRFGNEVMPELTGSNAIEKVGTKPTMYAVTPQGYAVIKSSQTP